MVKTLKQERDLCLKYAIALFTLPKKLLTGTLLIEMLFSYLGITLESRYMDPGYYSSLLKIGTFYEVCNLWPRGLKWCHLFRSVVILVSVEGVVQIISSVGVQKMTRKR